MNEYSRDNIRNLYDKLVNASIIYKYKIEKWVNKINIYCKFMIKKKYEIVYLYSIKY